ARGEPAGHGRGRGGSGVRGRDLPHPAHVHPRVPASTGKADRPAARADESGLFLPHRLGGIPALRSRLPGDRHVPGMEDPGAGAAAGLTSMERPLSAHDRHVQNLGAVAEHVFHEHAAVAPAAREGRLATRLRRWGAPGVMLAVLLGKLKYLLVVAKVLKLSTLASMLLMVGVYGSVWGFPFAVGFVLLIFVHELGRALGRAHEEIHPEPCGFSPFVGAVIAMRGRPRDAYVEALVGIGGPVA